MAREFTQDGSMRYMIFTLAAFLTAQEVKLTQVWIYDTKDSLEAAKGGGRRPALEVTPVYENGRIYVATPWGTIAALDAKDGREIWRVCVSVND
jgi:glucose dehydrogenase